METRLERTVRSWTQEWLEQGKAEGLARGTAEGLARGTAEGLARGTAEGLARGTAEGLARGTAEGLARGTAEGRLEGRRETLRSLLTIRFGHLSPAAVERIATAEEAMLDQWLPRVLSAGSVDDVLR